MKMRRDLICSALAATAFAFCPNANAAPEGREAVSRHAQVDDELAQDLAGWASRLSGRASAPGAELPVFVALADDALSRTVCGAQHGGCRGVVAAYDTDRLRVVYRASLDMRDPTDQSFIVHELVHWLQHQARGASMLSTCEEVLDAEHEAYRVQNLYLTRFKQWQRMGAVLRFTYCTGDTSEQDEPAIRVDMSTGPTTAARPPAPPAAADRSPMPPHDGRGARRWPSHTSHKEERP